jgi:hypothetical protein
MKTTTTKDFSKLSLNKLIKIRMDLNDQYNAAMANGSDVSEIWDNLQTVGDIIREKQARIMGH